MSDDQMLTAVAVAVATTAVTQIAEGGKAAFAGLVRLIRQRFESRGAEQQALLAPASDSTDEDRVHSLRAELISMAATDVEFAYELQRRWQELRPFLPGGDGVHNTVLGEVSGNVVQTREVHGGISFGNVVKNPPA